MNIRLNMDRDHIGPCFYVLDRVTAGLLDHEVGIDGHVRGFADGPDDRQADSNVRYEMPVHDIDMQYGRTTRLYRLYRVGKPGKICRKYRRSYFKHSSFCLLFGCVKWF